MKTCSEIRFSVRTPWLLVTTAWPRERASVLVKIRRPARSSQQPGPAHTQHRPAESGRKADGASLEPGPGSCGSWCWPVSVTAVTAARPRLPGPHTLVLSSHWRDVTLSLAWAPWSRDHSRPWPGTWPGPAEQIVCITGLAACDQGRLWSREQDNQAQEQR